MSTGPRHADPPSVLDPLLREMALANGEPSAVVGVYSRTVAPDYCGQGPEVFTSLPEYKEFVSKTMGRAVR